MAQVSQNRLEIKDMNLIKYYSSGFALYALSSLMANPFLLVKRRLQLGIDGGVVQTCMSEGPKSLFRGGSLCWVSGSNRMLYFTMYEYVTNLLENINKSYIKERKLSCSNGYQSMSTGVAAAVASITSQLILTPFSVITTRIHVNRGPPVSSLQVIESVVKSHGGWGILWTGYFSALLQSIPHNMVMFTVYNFTKTSIVSTGSMNTPEKDLAGRLLCSVVGSYAAILVTSPIDITRTHRQSLISSGMADCGVAVVSHKVPSSWAVLKDIFSNYGVKYMYRGSTARFMSSTPYTMAMLIGYDYVKMFSIKEK